MSLRLRTNEPNVGLSPVTPEDGVEPYLQMPDDAARLGAQTTASLPESYDEVSSTDVAKGPRKKILTVFGTRPEVIKLAPVISQLEGGLGLTTVNVTTAQHTDLLYPFIHLFGIRVDHDLQIMEPGQTPNQVCSKVLARLDTILDKEMPDLVLVQGDTTTALGGAMAAFHRRIPVAHVEAGLRSGNTQSPYPEEMNRKLITCLATYHFAATNTNRGTLLSEGVAEERIFVTGNPVIDSLEMILKQPSTSPALEELLTATMGMKRLVLTTHRREGFGEAMAENLKALRRFVERHEDVALLFPVHPNPAVVESTRAILSGNPRIHLIAPLNYEEFITLLSQAWLIVSDSGGVQEEAPTLGKPLLILRENTERPEAVASGVARLVGGCPGRLETMLEEVLQDGNWAAEVRKVENPFGRGDSGKRIAEAIEGIFKDRGRAVTGRAIGESPAPTLSPVEQVINRSTERDVKE